jgi:hypothetical protein
LRSKARFIERKIYFIHSKEKNGVIQGQTGQPKMSLPRESGGGGDNKAGGTKRIKDNLDLKFQLQCKAGVNNQEYPVQ